MRTEQISAIRAACIAANPQLIKPCGHRQCDGGEVGPIRLSNVLLTLSDIETDWKSYIAPQYRMCLVNKETGTHAYWNLRADSLDGQNDETIAFIHSLLV
jgi:hypothetical protein